MRPQQNRRMRGRGNNNNNNNRNRTPNPLTRNYESNGPDVKIRGNAQHIADKYTTLARDAQASGDRVMAENYLQHAEHYMRIILSAQPQIVHNIRDDTGYESSDSTNVVDLPLTNTSETLTSEALGEAQDANLQLIDSQIEHHNVTEVDNSVDVADIIGSDVTTLDAVTSPPKPSNDRPPRRITRRRLPRQVVTDVENVAPVSKDAARDAKTRRAKSAKTPTGTVEAETPVMDTPPVMTKLDDAIEKPRRRRRVLKNEDGVVAAS